MKGRSAAPYTRTEGLPTRLENLSSEYGYNGLWGIVRYSLKFLINYYLNWLAMLMPYSGPRVIIHRMRGVNIGKNVLIGHNVTLDNTYPHLIIIKDGASLAGHNLVLAHSKPLEYHKKDFSSYTAPVVIEKDAWITVGVIILAGSTIGEGSVVAAGSVVTSDIPPDCLAAGNPARVIKRLNIQVLTG
jgi:acetyltransferase-like isoleucine patch superfamily enzyme